MCDDFGETNVIHHQENQGTTIRTSRALGLHRIEWYCALHVNDNHRSRFGICNCFPDLQVIWDIDVYLLVHFNYMTCACIHSYYLLFVSVVGIVPMI